MSSNVKLILAALAGAIVLPKVLRKVGVNLP